MATFCFDLRNFHVSDRYGFMLENPLESLPDYFQPWNDLAKQMPSLVATKMIRTLVHQMEQLDHTRLQNYREYRLAHLQLCLIAAGYIWQDGDGGVAQVLPKCIAVPWYAVSEKIGIHPVLCHPSLVLANWKLRDPNKPVELGNLQSLYELPPSGPEAEWFIVVTAQVELDFAAGLKHIVGALRHAEQGDTEELKVSFEEITAVVKKIKITLSKMHDHLSGDTFYNKMRPYLQGWGGATSPLPDGLVYEGVSMQPMQMVGGSAAQSSTMQTLDAALGIEHQADKQDFLHKMRDYMPPAHKNFIETIARQSKIKQLVQSSKSDELTDAYNKCVAAVTDVRSYHIQLVTKYIVVMSNKASRNKNFEAVSKVGTGGSSVIPFLKSLRESTKESLISEAESKTSKAKLENGHETTNGMAGQDSVANGHETNSGMMGNESVANGHGNSDGAVNKKKCIAGRGEVTEEDVNSHIIQ